MSKCLQSKYFYYKISPPNFVKVFEFSHFYVYIFHILTPLVKYNILNAFKIQIICILYLNILNNLFCVDRSNNHNMFIVF